MKKLKKKDKKAWVKSLSALCVNISAGWLGLALIGPNISAPKTVEEFIVLTTHVILGIVFLVISVLLERKIL